MLSVSVRWLLFLGCWATRQRMAVWALDFQGTLVYFGGVKVALAKPSERAEHDDPEWAATLAKGKELCTRRNGPVRREEAGRS